MKADKGTCFVVLDREEYDQKMESFLTYRNADKPTAKSPFGWLERDLTATRLKFKKKHKIEDSIYKQPGSTDGIPPAVSGSIKHHKEGNPLRSIVTCIGLALYDTWKFLPDILTPIQNRNKVSVLNSQSFSLQAV